MEKENPKTESFQPSADLALDNIYIVCYIYELRVLSVGDRVWRSKDSVDIEWTTLGDS